jgi:hypothetical protein
LCAENCSLEEKEKKKKKKRRRRRRRGRRRRLSSFYPSLTSLILTLTYMSY